MTTSHTKIRIAIFTPTNRAWGGAYQYARAIANSLAQLDKGIYDVRLWYEDADSWEDFTQTISIPAYSIQYNSAADRMLPPLDANLSRIPFAVRQFMPHIVMLPQMSSLWYCPDAKHISVVHDLMHRYEPSFPEASCASEYMSREITFKNIFTHCHTVLVDSSIGKTQCLESYEVAKDEQIQILPYVAFDELVKITPQQPVFNLPQKFFFYPAQFWLHKNHINLAHALVILKKKYADICVVATGGVDKNGFVPFKKEAERLGVLENFILPGYVSDAEVAWLYKHATALVMPTFFGPTNIPPLEAMALGCPATVSDIYGMRERCGDAVLYFNPKSPAGIAKNLEQLWVNADLREQLRQKGLRKTAMYNVKAFEKRVISLVTKIAEKLTTEELNIVQSPPSLVPTTQGEKGWWQGSYATWQEVENAATGYAQSETFLRVYVAAKAVQEGKALWERDSVTFQHEDYNIPFLQSMLHILEKHDSLHVLDFGGALGSTFVQHKSKLLCHGREVSWNIVEKEHIVNCGKSEFSTEHIQFFYDAEAALQYKAMDVALFSGVIQYLDQDFLLKILDTIAEHNVKYIVFDRTPFRNAATLFALEYPESIYHGQSFAMCFYNFIEFDHVLNERGFVLDSVDMALDGSYDDCAYLCVRYKKDIRKNRFLEKKPHIECVGLPDTIPFISVVVPTYNRQDKLPLTLDSLFAQNYPHDKFQVIVCNNNSTDATEHVLQNYRNEYGERCLPLFEERQGVHYARNRAAHMSKGDILYYTDDDMIADSHILRSFADFFMRHPHVASATGKVLPYWLATPPQWLVNFCSNTFLSLINLGNAEHVSKADLGVFSCHQAMRRDVFFQTNGFHVENVAGEWLGDGETGLNQTIMQLGFSFGYTPNAVTWHITPPSRMTQEYLNKRLAMQGSCDSYTAYRLHRYTPEELVKNMMAHSMQAEACRNLYKEQLAQNNEQWHITLANVHYYLGRHNYDKKLLNDPKWQEMVLRNDWLEKATALNLKL